MTDATIFRFFYALALCHTIFFYQTHLQCWSPVINICRFKLFKFWDEMFCKMNFGYMGCKFKSCQKLLHSFYFNSLGIGQQRMLWWKARQDKEKASRKSLKYFIVEFQSGWLISVLNLNSTCGSACDHVEFRSTALTVGQGKYSIVFLSYCPL